MADPTPPPGDVRVLAADQIDELDKQVAAAELEVARQMGASKIVSGEAARNIEFHGIEYLRRCIITIRSLSAIPGEAADNLPLTGPSFTAEERAIADAITDPPTNATDEELLRFGNEFTGCGCAECIRGAFERAELRITRATGRKT